MANKGNKPVSAPGTAAEASKESPMKKNSFTGMFRSMSKTTLIIIAILFFGGIAFFTTLIVMAHVGNLRASSAEYDHLRILAGDVDTGSGDDGAIQLSALDLEMRQINPDFVCWIRIDGTNIDYPVVRGSDNEKYLDTSFGGDKNIAGAIFMDYRNIGDPIPHIIIYGHNLQQGGMFTDLRRFLNNQFLEENNIITLTVNGHDVEFEIFSARLTDVDDPAYNLDLSTPRLFARFADRINAPLAATQIITLSTCTSGGNDNARMIVQGYRLFD